MLGGQGKDFASGLDQDAPAGRGDGCIGYLLRYVPTLGFDPGQVSDHAHFHREMLPGGEVQEMEPAARFEDNVGRANRWLMDVGVCEVRDLPGSAGHRARILGPFPRRAAN